MTHLRINLKTISVNLGPGALVAQPVSHWNCNQTI